jgi:hypothetical protein
MSELVSLIPTPRAAKRLGNIYRLIRAGISPGHLPKFLGNGQGDGEYKTVMSLLAVQVGFPLVSNEFFARIRANSTQSWAEVRAAFEAEEDDTPGQRGNGAKPQPYDASVVWSRERARLLACMRTLIDEQKLGGSPGAYLDWVDKVNRYSFRAVEQEFVEV